VTPAVPSLPKHVFAGSQVPATVSAGLESPATIRAQSGGRIVIVETVNPDGVPVGNACVDIFEHAGGGQPGRVITGSCAAPEGDPGNGVIYFQGISPGQYVVIETILPADFAPAANTLFSVPAEGTGAITVTVPHQPESGSLVEQLVAVLIEILRNILGR